MAKRKTTRRRVRTKIVWALAAAGVPATIGFLLLYIVPVIITGMYSLLDNSFSRSFVGLENYAAIWRNSYFLLALKNTAVITLLLVLSASLLAILTGYLLYKHPSMTGWGISLLLLPLLMPSASMTTLWKALFQTSSFSSTWVSYTALTTLFVWKYAGTGAMLVYIGLKEIEPDILHAAALDGATPLCIYTRISLPMIVNHIALMLLFFLMFAFRIYKECYLLFGLYPPESIYLIAHYMNNHFQKMNFQNVGASAISLSGLSILLYGLAALLLQKRRQTVR